MYHYHCCNVNQCLKNPFHKMSSSFSSKALEILVFLKHFDIKSHIIKVQLCNFKRHINSIDGYLIFFTGAFFFFLIGLPVFIYNLILFLNSLLTNMYSSFRIYVSLPEIITTWLVFQQISRHFVPNFANLIFHHFLIHSTLFLKSDMESS